MNRPSQQLWNANLDLAEACLRHPFVQGIASGDLPRASFTFYVGQDAYFLNAFGRAYAVALAKSPDQKAMGQFRRLLDDVYRELELHSQYAEQWGVDLDPKPAEATLAYTDFLLRVAWGESISHTLAAMIPCMRLYAYLGRSLLPVLDPESPYKDWVTTYGSNDFENSARTVEQLLDEYGDGSPVLAELYRRAMQLEYSFFDQAWSMAV